MTNSDRVTVEEARGALDRLERGWIHSAPKEHSRAYDTLRRFIDQQGEKPEMEEGQVVVDRSAFEFALRDGFPYRKDIVEAVLSNLDAHTIKPTEEGDE